ncbi:hypothetical protein ACLB2K_055865 [Fragaria x ananassa]
MTQLPRSVQQLLKLTDIHEVQNITHLPFAERELMLIKIAVNASASRDVLHIAGIFCAKAGVVSDHTIALEKEKTLWSQKLEEGQEGYHNQKAYHDKAIRGRREKEKTK